MVLDPKLKVGLVFDDTLDSNDGVAQYVKGLGEWLSLNGHEVSYLVGQTKIKEWAGGKVYSLARNQSITWAGNRLSIPLPAGRKPIKELVSKMDFDIIHVQVPYSPFMAQRVINGVGNKTVVIGTFHVYPGNRLAVWGSRLLTLWYGKSLKRFDQMISVSSAAADFAKNSYGLLSTIVPNMVDIQKFAGHRAFLDKSRPQIVFLGRLVPRKGCRELLVAFAELSKRLPDVELVIAGDGNQRRELENYVISQQLQDRVRFLGRVTEAEKPKLLARADIACFPSLYGESFGIVLIEAMAAGSKIVLGGDNPGYKSVLSEQPDLIISPNNKHTFAERLELLLMDQNRITKLHQWQSSTVKQYDTNQVCEQVLAIYRQAIAKQIENRHN
jgi:phosphatidylinositol alpha-mannosyltransferase